MNKTVLVCILGCGLICTLAGMLVGIASRKDKEEQSSFVEIIEPTSVETILEWQDDNAVQDTSVVNNIEGFDYIPYYNNNTPLGEDILETLDNDRINEIINKNNNLLFENIIAYTKHTASIDTDGEIYYSKEIVEIDSELNYKNKFIYSEEYQSNPICRVLQDDMSLWIIDDTNKVYAKANNHKSDALKFSIGFGSYLNNTIKSADKVSIDGNDYNRIVVYNPDNPYTYGDNGNFCTNSYLYFNKNDDIEYVISGIYNNRVYATSIKDIERSINKPNNSIDSDYTEIDYDDLDNSIKNLFNY